MQRRVIIQTNMEGMCGMARIFNSAAELVGSTPLVALKNISERLGIRARLLAKLEYMNPAGSAKDRIALNMIETAEREGLLRPDSVIIEPTSGNTGIGLAAVAAARGYKTMIVMPDTMSVERRRIMAAYGAQVVLTDGRLGMKGAIARAEELCATIEGAFIPGQFTNSANPEAHYKTTGPEIYRDTDGEVDLFVAGVGTGGTVSGVGKYLKEKNPNVKIIAVEPHDSPVLSGGAAAPHRIQGIGAGFIPAVLDTDIYDEVMTVTTEEAYETARLLGRCEGILVGVSSGAALSAALKISALPENEGKTVVVLFPDGGERYLSGDLFG